MQRVMFLLYSGGSLRGSPILLPVGPSHFGVYIVASLFREATILEFLRDLTFVCYSTAIPKVYAT